MPFPSPFGFRRLRVHKLERYCWLSGMNLANSTRPHGLKKLGLPSFLAFSARGQRKLEVNKLGMLCLPKGKWKHSKTQGVVLLSSLQASADRVMHARVNISNSRISALWLPRGWLYNMESLSLLAAPVIGLFGTVLGVWC